MNFLTEYKLNRIKDGYPFVPLIKNTQHIAFNSKVTIICGDNGCENLGSAGRQLCQNKVGRPFQC